MPAKAVPKALGPQAPTQGDNAPPTATPAIMPKARCPKAPTPDGTAPQGGTAPEAQQGATGAHKFPLVNWDPGSIPDPSGGAHKFPLVNCDPGSIPDPSLPANELADSMTGEETAQLMYGIVKVVRADLSVFFRDSPQVEKKSWHAGVGKAATEPLTIRERDANREILVSYKAPWAQDQAETALKQTGIYEAAGNVFWAHPIPDEADRALTGPHCTWSEISEAAALFEVTIPQGSDIDDEEAKRILFPGKIPLFAPTQELFLLPGASFNGTLKPLASHVLLQGWYFKMYRLLSHINGPATRPVLNYCGGSHIPSRGCEKKKLLTFGRPFFFLGSLAFAGRGRFFCYFANCWDPPR
jgi:hypothetical protein